MPETTYTLTVSPDAPPKVTPLGAAAVDAPQDDPQTNAVFGLVFVLNGTEVPITTDDIAKAATEGVEFEIPNPVSLGSIQNIIEFVNNTFNVNIPSGDSLPPPLNNVVAGVLNTQFEVTYFHIKVPPRDGGPVQFTLRMNATLAAPVDLIPNVLQINGAVFGVTNEESRQS